MGLLSGKRPAALGARNGNLKAPPSSPAAVSSEAAGGYLRSAPPACTGSPEPEADLPEDSGAQADSSEDIPPWWRRSPPLAAAAALAIGLATLWFANMLGRVPLDSQAAFAYLLMLPLLLIVPAFAAAGLRLSWLALRRSHDMSRWIVGAIALAAMAANGFAIAGFGTALLRIFGH